MTRTFRKALVAVAAALALLPLSPVTGLGGAVVDGADENRSWGLELVTTIGPSGGTDLEFFSRELETYMESDGTLVTPEDGPVERHFALVGNWATAGTRVVDITDPEDPYVAASVPNCTASQGDVQVTQDGMVAAIARQGGGSCRTHDGATVQNGSAIVDLSDVYAPVVAGRAPESAGSHNQTIHPDGKYMYISTSSLNPNSGANSRVPIFDISDPYSPQKVRDWTIPVNGPHDIRFSHDGTRAYFAGISAYHVVNTEDPANPSIISTMVPPGGTIGHDTLITKDKRFLFLGDEAGGGGTYPCPGGAVYVYDLLDERAPILLGAAEAGGGPVTNRHIEDVPGPVGVGGCTSHVMELNPDGQSLTLGWYRLGTRVFDFSSFYEDDGSPKTAAGIAAAWGQYGVGLVESAYIVPDGGSTWSAKQYEKVPGYVFSNDMSLGFYVSRILDEG